jgi:hypothetical protein
MTYLGLYAIGAVVQLGIGAYALRGAIGVFRGSATGASQLRRSSVVLLIFLAVVWTAVILAVLVGFGWRNPMVLLPLTSLVLSGAMLAALPLATLKWLHGAAVEG